MYSRIPVICDISSEAAEKAIMFLPLVGALTGIITYGSFVVFSYVDVPVFVRATVFLIIPIAVTGGFHIDGFLDTEDALRSYRDREKKLEILKDPHVGAFAVTGFTVCVLLMLAGLGTIAKQRSAIIAVSASYVISRSLCALTSLCMKKAKDDGMLVSETRMRDKGMITALIVQLAGALLVTVMVDPFCAAATVVSYASVTVIYKRIVSKDFGGVTGDTAGYFVVISEVASVDAIALYEVISKLL